MNKRKLFFLPILGLAAMFLLATPAIAGGGPVEFNYTPTSPLNPGDQYIVHARVYTNGPYPSYCKNCFIKLALKDSQSGDYIAQDSERTNDEGRIYAKVISKVSGSRTVYVSELKDNDGQSIEANSTVVLPYRNQPSPIAIPQAPTMIYPQNGQTLDLEGAYMFKVTPVAGASGYLFGLFQDGVMVYENYRDTRTLSNNGEFALWESNPAHKKFHNGEMKVMVRALYNNQWTDAREIYISLKPRGNTTVVVNTTVSYPAYTPLPSVKVNYTSRGSTPSANTNTTLINTKSYPSSSSAQTVVHESSKSAQLEQKVADLQQQLDQSQKRQSALEERINQLTNWIKSLFLFFKS